MIKTYAKVSKNNTSIRLSIDKTIVDMLEMSKTNPDTEVWEIFIARKLTKKQLQDELKQPQGT